MIEQFLIVYLRLSKEDEGRKDESNSITNQRRLHEDYISNHENLQNNKRLEFVDDGYSGTNFDRPGIKKILELVKRGKVCCILVKDLSRFGRDYIEVGNYLEHIFPALGIRFIAINDNFDSDDYKEDVPGIDIAVKNIMNSFMSQEQSDKVKGAIQLQRQTGEHVGASVPYGYKKISGHGNKLFVDDEAADVVKRIFYMTLEGIGRSEIARVLNAEGILTAGDYKKSKKRLNKPFVRGKEWGSVAVVNVLKNEAYIGTAISGQHYRPEMGKRYVERAPKEKWVVVEEAHEAIINKSDFLQVQQAFKMQNHVISESKELLSGMLSCAHCGRAMVLRRRKSGMCCYCDNYRRNPASKCNREKIALHKLEIVVLQILMKEMEVLANMNNVIKKAALTAKANSQVERTQNVCDTKEDFQKQKKVLYEEYKASKITLETYRTRRGELDERLEHMEEKEEEGEQDLQRDKREEDIGYFADKYKDINYLSKDMLKELVRRIYVYDVHNIRVDFKFQDLFTELEK